MSKLYNENYVSFFDDSDLKSVFYNGSYNEAKDVYSIDINDNREFGRALYNCFQHYLVKLLSEGKEVAKCYAWLRKYYYDFMTNPEVFANSPLLKNDFLKSLPYNTEKIREVRHQYYSVSRLMFLYNKKDREGLTDNELKNYYAILLHFLPLNKANINVIIEQEIDSIIKRDRSIRDMNDMELLFYCQYVSNFAKGNNNFETMNFIFSENSNLGGFHSKYVIGINKSSDYFESLLKITQVVCHETRHAVQEYDSKSKINAQAFYMAFHRLFQKYISNNLYKEGDNYDFSRIELDAENLGYYNAGLFFYTRNFKEKNNEINKLRKERLDTRDFFRYYTDLDGKKHPYDDFVVSKVDEIIKIHPEELNNYPSLNTIYDKNGKRKSFSELVKASDFDTRDFLGLYFSVAIRNGQLNQIDLNSMNKEEQISFNDFLSARCRDYCYDLNKYLDSIKTKRYLSVREIRTTSHLVRTINKVYEYIDQHFDKVASFSNDDYIVNSPIFNYIYFLRNVPFESIAKGLEKRYQNSKDNSEFKNNPMFDKYFQNFKSNFLKLGENYKNVLYKYNKVIIGNKLKKISVSELNQIITYNGNKMTLMEYYINVVLPNMDGNQNVLLDGVKVYISDYIKQFNSTIFGEGETISVGSEQR